ncbi:Thiosulfate/3-mercaptopyruvate sulfurtransferase 1, mitochondrial [Galdieria sulphuraria]|nr:Thiosulfate/3-mercaptopyruvate sulfurtransferase 1, mitochondrial [Galdieria sulphuraria]
MPKDQCFILKGGLEEWKKHGYPLASGPIEEKESIHSKTFVPKFQSQLVADRLQVKDSLKSGTAIILDARSAGRFYGTEPEPRQGVPSGHIEKAMSLPFVQLLTKDGQELLPKEDLMKVFENHGIDIKTNQKIICMCGSGVTATVVHLALDQLNVFTSCVYDGSWMDWTMKGEKE